MKNLYIKTYGCQQNAYDSGRMVDILKPLGYALTDTPDNADLVILNTCHIREKAEEKVYSDLGRIRARKGDDAIVAVGGCMAQAEGAEIIRRAPYVDMVFGPQTYHRLPEMIARAHRSQDKKAGPGRGIVDVDFPAESKFDFLPPSHTHVGMSAFLAIQEGCDKFCTYCVVPYTRGAEYSRPPQDLINEAQQLLAEGAKEIMLLGQNVNAYKADGWSFGRLIEALAQLPGLLRIRYMTSHPRDMDEDLMMAHRDVPQLMPFLHLPVQSGSEKILKAMNRQHTPDFYRNIIDKIKTYRPDIAFSSDFIVGFPGETDQDFEDTLSLVRDVEYAQAYSFKYSPRPGTPGAVMDQQVPEELKVERLARLQELLNAQQVKFNQASIGKIMPVLLDRKGTREGQALGKTPYAQSVHVDVPDHLLGTCVNVRIEQAFANSVTGQVI